MSVPLRTEVGGDAGAGAVVLTGSEGAIVGGRVVAGFDEGEGEPGGALDDSGGEIA